MPNWCSNNLTISGDASEIAKFNAWLGDEPLTLQKIKPMPSELEDTTSPTPDSESEKAKILTEKYGAANWYDWHIQNWGTKWDIEADFDDGSSTDDCLIYNFDSAWSPPIQAMVTLAKLFPNLGIRMTYREDGMQFAGVFKAAGKIFVDVGANGDNKEEYRQFIIDEFGDDPFENEEEEDLDHESKGLATLAKSEEDVATKKKTKKIKKVTKKVKKAAKKPVKKVKKKKK